MEYWLLLHLFIICNDCWGAMAWIIESCCSPSFPTSLLLLQRILHHWGINVPRLHLWSPLPFILWLLALARCSAKWSVLFFLLALLLASSAPVVWTTPSSCIHCSCTHQETWPAPCGLWKACLLWEPKSHLLLRHILFSACPHSGWC